MSARGPISDIERMQNLQQYQMSGDQQPKARATPRIPLWNSSDVGHLQRASVELLALAPDESMLPASSIASGTTEPASMLMDTGTDEWGGLDPLVEASVDVMQTIKITGMITNNGSPSSSSSSRGCSTTRLRYKPTESPAELLEQCIHAYLIQVGEKRGKGEKATTTSCFETLSANLKKLRVEWVLDRKTGDINELQGADWKLDAKGKVYHPLLCIAAAAGNDTLGKYQSAHAEVDLLNRLPNFGKEIVSLFCNMAPCSSCRVALALLGITSTWMVEYVETRATLNTDWIPPTRLTDLLNRREYRQSFLEDALSTSTTLHHNVIYKFTDLLICYKCTGDPHIISITQSFTTFVVNIIKRLRGNN